MAQRVLDDGRREHRLAAAGKAVEPQERTGRSQPCVVLWALDKPEASARVLLFAGVVVVDRSIRGLQPVSNLGRHLTGPHQLEQGLSVTYLILDAANVLLLQDLQSKREIRTYLVNVLVELLQGALAERVGKPTAC